MPDAPGFRRRVALALGSLLFALVAAEIVVRLALRDEWEPQRLRDELATFDIGALARFSDDPRLYFELEPELQVPFGRGIVVTNAEGRRVPDEPLPTPPGLDTQAAPVRLAVVGDSTCFGWRIPFAFSYPELLRRRLELTWGRPVELRNYCVPGYNTEQQVSVFESAIVAWSPDLLIWHYDHNDAMPALIPGTPIGMPVAHGDNLLRSALVKVVLRRWRRHELRTRQLRDPDAAGRTEYPSSGPLYERHLAALGRMADLARRRQLPVLVVIWDADLTRRSTPGEHYDRLHRELLQSLDGMGIAVLDLYEPLQALMQSEGWTDLRPQWLSVENPVDAHPNRRGHRFLADTLAEHILAWPDAPADGPPARLR